MNKIYFWTQNTRISFNNFVPTIFFFTSNFLFHQTKYERNKTWDFLTCFFTNPELFSSPYQIFTGQISIYDSNFCNLGSVFLTKYVLSKHVLVSILPSRILSDAFAFFDWYRLCEKGKFIIKTGCLMHAEAARLEPFLWFLKDTIINVQTL